MLEPRLAIFGAGPSRVVEGMLDLSPDREVVDLTSDFR